jgi:hypothetical protein
MPNAQTENGQGKPTGDPPDGGEPAGAAAVAQGANEEVQGQPPPAPPTGTPPPVDEDDAALGITSDGTVHSVPQEAFAKLKQREREKGREEAQQAHQRWLDEQAKALGFDSFAAFMAATKPPEPPPQAAAPPPAKPEPEPPKEEPPVPKENKPQGQEPAAETPIRPARSGMTDRVRKRFRKERSQHASNMSKMRTRNQRLKGERNSLKGRLIQQQTEMELREIAIKTGVTDLDYAMTLLRRELKGKTAEDLKDFKPKDFFEGQREPRPYLFSEVKVPATTGTEDGAETPPPQTPAAAAQQTADGAKIDATKMTDEEYKAYLRKRGWSQNATTPGGDRATR